MDETETTKVTESSKKKKKGKRHNNIEDESFGINDRVFVCFGKLKDTG